MVSIIIPVYNRERLLNETINSILDQTYTNWELILVDDGSTDRSIKIAEEFSKKDARIRPFKRNRMPKGAPTCRNIGLEESQGEFIQFFDSDDIMERNCLHEKLHELEMNKALDFTVSKTAFLLGNGDIKDIDQYFVYPSSFLEFLSNKTIFLTPGPMFRTEFIRKFDVAFDTNLQRHQEFEFYSRIMMENPSFSFLGNVHCFYRLHDNSIKGGSKNLGNLYYRYTKCLAIFQMNRNSHSKYVADLYLFFVPYFKTTIKVAVYHRSVFKAIHTLLMLSKLAIMRGKRSEVFQS